MCRMAAFSTKEVVDISSLFEIVSWMAKNGKKAEHSDGYGVLVFDEISKFEYKTTVPIYDDFRGRELVKQIHGKLGLIHARKASQGVPVGLQQLHPFHIRGRYLAHNGTITGADRSNAFQSDTYGFFSNVVDFEDFESLVNNVKRYISTHDFTGVNFLLVDEFEKALYVGCIYKKDVDYFTLHYKIDALGFYVYSEQMEDSLLEMENGEILKVVEGNIVEQGKVF